MKQTGTELVTKEFETQCIAYPRRVEAFLATQPEVEEVTEELSRSVAFQQYVKQLKAGIEYERPIALGTLKLKARLGDLMPRQKPGPGKKLPNPGLENFSDKAKAAYRKLSDNKEKLDEYYEEIPDEIPTQTDFLKWSANGQHKTFTGEYEWYTPADWISRAIGVMGEIDLDPASSEDAQDIVGALEYFTEEDDGLQKEWHGCVWLNPPYKNPLVSQFANKLCDEFESGNVRQAVLLVNSSTDTAWFHRCAEVSSAMAITLGRISFISDGKEQKGNSTGQVFFYFGKRVAKFRDVFRKADCMVFASFD